MICFFKTKIKTQTRNMIDWIENQVQTSKGLIKDELTDLF